MQYLFMTLFAAGIVAVDQITKCLTVANIALYEKVPFIPGFLGLTYVQNTGAAFSSFEGARWLFVLVFAIFTVALIYEFTTKKMGFSSLERWLIVAVYGGGLGNVIDRVRLGYVIDMFETEFIEFPVFNVADCFITCGCILFMAHLILCNRKVWKEEKK